MTYNKTLIYRYLYLQKAQPQRMKNRTFITLPACNIAKLFDTFNRGVEFMLTTRRQPGDRRWGLSDEYPLHDNSGSVVLADRRRMPDRRMADATMEEWAALLSKTRQENN